MTAVRTRIVCLTSLAVLAAAFAPSAQQGGAPVQPPPQRPPIFRADARLVRVDAYPARDGRIIEGLSAADFEVFEDGKPQTIDGLEFINSAAAVIPETERRDPNSQRDGFALASDPRYRIFVLYLDSLHVGIEGSHATRRPMVDMLNRMLGKYDLFGVLTPYQEPMRDLMLGQQTLSIDEQLQKYWTWGTKGIRDPEDEALMLLGCFSPEVAEPLIARHRLDNVFSDLEETVTILGGLREERKNILLFTSGWLLPRSEDLLAPNNTSPPRVAITDAGKPTLGARRSGFVDPRACNDELNRLKGIDFQQRHRELIARAREQNVTFYPVNPMGLEAGGSVFENRAISYRGDRLRELAEGTDGIPIVATNDLQNGLQRVVNDLSAQYVLSYYSTNTKWDGGVRRIEVRLKPSGAKVRARREYRAPTAAEMAVLRNPPAPAKPSVPTGVEEAFSALKRLRPSSTVNTYGRAVGSQVSVVGEIAAAHIEAGRWKTGGEMQVIVTGASGEIAGTAMAKFAPGTRGAVATIAATTPGPWEVVVRVRGEGDAPEEDRFIVNPSSGSLLADPLVFRSAPAQSSPLRPVAGLQFRRTERVVVEWPLLTEPERLEARMLGRDGKVLGLNVPIAARTSASSRVAAADLNLAPLTAGDYVIEATATAGGATETRRIAIRVMR